MDAVALETYKGFHSDFTFGIVAVVNPSVQAISPLKVEDGRVVKNVSGATFGSLDATIYNAFDTRLTYKTEAAKAANVVFCAYVYDGTKLQYIENGAIVNTVSGNSFDNIVSSLAE